MNTQTFKKINEDGWDDLIRNKKAFSNTSLPEYGPFMSGEEKFGLFKDVRGKKVLEMGCGGGKSLKYLAERGASELWGVDISSEQLHLAKAENIPNSHFVLAPMEEENTDIPKDYFDYILSLYSIGYSSDPHKTLKLASSYLKSGGRFVLSWTHPLFNCLAMKDDEIIINHNYTDEEAKQIFKGPDKIPMMQYNLKISTLVNSLIKSGLEIVEIIEENPHLEVMEGDFVSTFWDPKKLKASPTTLIIVAQKK